MTNIWSALDLIFADPEARRQAKLLMAEYLVLDALIGNTDRRVPNDWMSPSTRSFAIALMSYTISELKELAR